MKRKKIGDRTSIDTIFVLDTPDQLLLRRLAHAAQGNCKTLFWANGAIDRTALIHWIPKAGETVIADHLIEEVAAIAASRATTPLSVFLGGRKRGLGGRPGGLPDTGHRPDDRPILFFPTNDTIAKTFVPIGRHLPHFIFATPVRWREEGAFQLLVEAGVPCMENHDGLLDETDPALVLFGNDWSSEEIALIQRARRRGIPTACLQEGCLDWGDAFARMEWSDFPIVQGPATLRFLDRQSYFAAGNPRFDALRPMALPARPRAMINCNFTYGVHEDARASWIHDVVSACRAAGVDFFISQHPRDPTQFPDLPVRRSGAQVVHEHLADCSILITRFSTLVYEAMLLGRPVIYYNPHAERMVTFNENSAGLLRAHDPSALDGVLRHALGDDDAQARLREAFLRDHCGSNDGRAAERCARTLEVIARSHALAPDVRRPRRGVLVPARRAISRIAHALLGDRTDP